MQLVLYDAREHILEAQMKVLLVVPPTAQAGSIEATVRHATQKHRPEIASISDLNLFESELVILERYYDLVVCVEPIYEGCIPWKGNVFDTLATYARIKPSAKVILLTHEEVPSPRPDFHIVVVKDMSERPMLQALFRALRICYAE